MFRPQMDFEVTHRQMPQSPPPAFVPPKPDVSYAIDCIFEYTYFWLRTGEQFWFYPIYVGHEGVAGYRWSGAYWYFDGIDSRFIDAVACPPIPTLY